MIIVPDVWRHSSFCSTNSCVEIQDLPDGRVAVRRSTYPSRPILVFDADEWAAFIAGVKAGEFDAPEATP